MLLYFEHHGPMLADSIAYRTLFSVFAGVFLGFAIAGVWLAGRPEAMDALIDTIDAVIPGLVGEDGLIHPDDLVQPLTLTIAGVLALIGLVGAAIGAIGALRNAFRNLGDQPDEQMFLGWIMGRDLLLAIGFAGRCSPRRQLRPSSARRQSTPRSAGSASRPEIPPTTARSGSSRSS